MKRPLLLLTTVALSVALLAATPAVGHSQRPIPSHSHAFGASLRTWEERWIGWVFGSSSDPLESDICGEQIHGVFFLNASLESGARLDCHLRPGTRLLGSPGGTVAWAPTDGQTRQELLASRDSFLSENSDPQATLDGHSLGNLDDALTLTDVFTIELQPGNFIQSVDPGVPGNETRVASGGWFLRLAPLSPGHHTLVLSNVIGGDVVDVTYDISVGGH